MQTDKLYSYIGSIRKLTSDIAASPNAVVPLCESLNLVNALIVSCSTLPLSMVLHLWEYVRETGVDPCWWHEFSKAICRFLLDISYHIYMSSSPIAALITKSSRLLSDLSAALSIEQNVDH